MVTAGIIAEYNPFHRGHQYHIEETRRLTGADFIVVVMSGCYVQRGEPAAADKYLRTQLALEGGADLVIELPVIYATASAEYFASAGVRLLDNLHCVDYLSFGSEKAAIKDYEPFVKILSEESSIYQKQLRESLKMGKNFPLAREEALRKCMRENYPEKQILWEIVEKPNHILGLEYLKSLYRLQSKIIPVAIKRQGAGYHDEDITKQYASASAIRRMLTEKEVEESLLFAAMGKGAIPFINQWKQQNHISWQELMPCLDYAVLMEEEEAELFFGFDGDMAARFQKLYRPGSSFSSLVNCLHTKRLTDAAWRRALLHRVLHIKKEEFLLQASMVPVPYARILGFKKRAVSLLKCIRENAKLSVIQRPAEGKLFEKDSAEGKLFATDIRAAQLYEQMAAAKSRRRPVSEWCRQQIIL